MSDNPFDQFDTPASAPPAPQQSAPANPFDQFDGAPAPVATPKQTPAPSPAQEQASVISGNSGVESARMSPEDERVLTGIYKHGSFDQALSFIHDRKYKIDEAGLHQFFVERDKGNPTAAAISYANSPKPQPKPKAVPDMSNGDAAVVGAVESIPGVNRLSAGVDAAVMGTLGLDHGKGYSGVYDDRLQFYRDQEDQAQQDHTGAYYGGMAAGIIPQLFIGTGEVGAGRALLQGAGVAGASELANTRQDLSTGEGWREAGKDAAKMAVFGGALGAATHNIASKVARDVSVTPVAERTQVADAAQRLSRDGVQIDVAAPQAGGKTAQGLAGIMENSPLVGGPIRKQIGRFQEGTRQAFARTADDAAPAGEIAQPMQATAKQLTDDTASGTLGSFRSDQTKTFAPQYEKVDSAVGTLPVSPKSSVAYLDSAIAAQRGKFRGDKATWLEDVQSIRDSLAKGDVPLSQLREYRTALRDELGPKFRDMSAGDRRSVEGVLDGLYNSITRDIYGTLRTSGNQTWANSLRKTDLEYAKMSETAKVIDPLLELPPEQLAVKLENLANNRGGDSDTLRTVMQSVSPEMRQRVEASFIHSLGLQNAGKASDEAAFSLDTFLTRFGGDGVKQGLSNDAKDILLRGQTRKDLEDLAVLSRAQRGYYQRVGNPSGTARNVNGFVGGIEAAKMLAKGKLGAVTGTLFGGWVTAKALASPGVSRVLVRIAKETRKDSPEITKTLEVLARRYPEQASELLGLRGYLLGGPEQQDSTAAQTGPSNASQGQDDAYFQQLQAANAQGISADDFANDQQSQIDDLQQRLDEQNQPNQ